MASILDMRTNNLNPSSFDYWTQEITNFFTPLKYLLTNSRLELFLKDVDVNYIVNTVFWIFLMFTLGFCGFYHLFHIKENTKRNEQMAQDIASINQKVSQLLDLKKEEALAAEHKLHYYAMFANLDRILNQLPPECAEELGIKYNNQAYEALNHVK